MNSGTRWLAGVLFVLGGYGLFAQTATPTNSFPRQPLPLREPSYVGEWSSAIVDNTNHMSLRARQVVSEIVGEAGTRTVIVCVELHNASYTQNTMYLYWSFAPSPLRYELRDSKGSIIELKVLEIDVGWDQPPCWLALPQDSTLRLSPYKVSPHVTASDGGRTIRAGSGYTRKLPRADKNDYFLSCTLTLSVPVVEARPRTSKDENGFSAIWRGTIELPAVKIPGNKQ